MNILPTFAGIFLAVTSLSSQATIISGWGASAGARTSDNCPIYCSGNSEYDGSGSAGSSFATAEENSYGMAKALVDMSGPGYLPTLKVKTSSAAGNGAGATAYSVQGFDYLGESNTNITLDFNLHGSVGGYGDGYSSNKLSANIGIIIGTELDFYSDFATQYFEAIGDGVQAGAKNLNISNGNDVNKASSISFNLEVGESFFIISEMNANSINGFVDAWNTLSFEFKDSTGLQAVGGIPKGNAIPEPSSIILVLLALPLLIRRKLTLK